MLLCRLGDWEQSLDSAQRGLDADSNNYDALTLIAVHAFTQESQPHDALQVSIFVCVCMYVCILYECYILGTTRIHNHHTNNNNHYNLYLWNTYMSHIHTYIHVYGTAEARRCA